VYCFPNTDAQLSTLRGGYLLKPAYVQETTLIILIIRYFLFTFHHLFDHYFINFINKVLY
jgi:hypothetical protein